MNDALKLAFPDMPEVIFSLLKWGDLTKELPDWPARFTAAFNEITSLRIEERRKRAWRLVLAAYDEAVVPNAEEVL